MLDLAVWSRSCRAASKTMVAMAEQHLGELDLSRFWTCMPLMIRFHCYAMLDDFGPPRVMLR